MRRTKRQKSSQLIDRNYHSVIAKMSPFAGPLTIYCSYSFLDQKAIMVESSYTEYNFYSITYDNSSAFIAPGNNWLIIRSPGNTNRYKTVSFQTPDGRWMKRYNDRIVVETFQDTEKFRDATTFCSIKGLATTSRSSFTFVSSGDTNYYIRVKPPKDMSKPFLIVTKILDREGKDDVYATWYLNKNTSE